MKLTRFAVYAKTQGSAWCFAMVLSASSWCHECYAQSPYSPYQPVSPPNAGGLPPGSRGLQQPVFIADRVTSREFQGMLSEEIASSDFREPLVGSQNVPPVDFTKFEAATLVAVVGRDPILIGDILDPKKVTQEQVKNPAFWEHLRKSVAEKILKKALSQKFFNDQLVGKPLKERQEAEAKMKTKVTQAFYNDMLPKIMQDQKCESIDEFCDIIEKQGLTLSALKDNYAESILAQECIRENVPKKPPVTLDDLSTYYESNQSEFQQPAKARFQILSALFSKHKTREEADRAIREMGNQVVFGTPFETVAKSSSSGMNAEQGGNFNWTTQGALKSKAIDDAVFSIELNRLSLIIEDKEGFHIVRVLERENARMTTFAEAQPIIKKKLIEAKKKSLHKEFIDKVKEQTTVWSKWPEDFPGARPISELE